jgi:K+-sensing histidine kinase KdpD
MTIRLLPQNLINQIAAGEVVERPASALKELMENAIDSGADRIVIEIQSGGVVFMRVSDNGCGIEPKRLETLFSGYYTSEREVVDSRKNAGIGLSVCATIIKAHGGTITAENAKSGGAVFRFSLDIEAGTRAS